MDLTTTCKREKVESTTEELKLRAFNKYNPAEKQLKRLGGSTSKSKKRKRGK